MAGRYGTCSCLPMSLFPSTDSKAATRRYRLDKSKRASPKAASGSKSVKLVSACQTSELIGCIAGEFRLDLREWLDDALRNLPWSERADGNGHTTPEGKGPPEASPASPDPLPASYKDDVLNQARCYLAVLVDEATFAELQPLMEDLGISAPVARSAVALQRSALACLTLSAHTDTYCRLSRPSTAWHRLGHGSLWTVSSAVTTARLLQIVCLLRLFLAYPGETLSSSSRSLRDCLTLSTKQRRNGLPPKQSSTSLLLCKTRSAKPSNRHHSISLRVTGLMSAVRRLRKDLTGRCRERLTSTFHSRGPSSRPNTFRHLSGGNSG